MKKAQLSQKQERRKLHGKLSTLFVAALVVVMLGVLVLLAWQRSTQQATGDYEGVIVERWAGYSESDLGSRPYFRLQIELKDGGRTTVRVDPNVYESARVGMRIKSRSGQIVLVDSQQPAGK